MWGNIDWNQLHQGIFATPTKTSLLNNQHEVQKDILSLEIDFHIAFSKNIVCVSHNCERQTMVITMTQKE